MQLNHGFFKKNDMSTTKSKVGRKPIPEEQKKKTVAIVISPLMIGLLDNDVKTGKAETINMRIVQILKEHFSHELNRS